MYDGRCYFFHKFGLTKAPDHRFKAQPGYHPGVFITGTTAGIGKHTALKLAHCGYTVFATYRNEKSAHELVKEFEDNYHGLDENKGKIVLVQLDVEDKQGIQRACHEVARHTEEMGIPLLAVVSNAGFCTIAGLEVTSKADIDRQFSLIFDSFIDVCKAFLPLIKKHRGRFIFLNSVGSFTIVPGFGIYCAAKGAMRNLTYALRMELSRFGVGVSSIEPGFINTEGIYDGTVNAFEAFFNDKDATGITSLGLPIHADSPSLQQRSEDLLGGTSQKMDEGLVDDYRKLVAEDWHRIMRLERMIATPPMNVAYNIYCAVSSPYNKASYVVGWDARMLSWMETLLPEDVLEWLMQQLFPWTKEQTRNSLAQKQK